MINSKHTSTIHILIIERESIISIELQKELESNGYTVRCAVTLENILQTIIIYKPQLIIADTPPDATYLRMIKNAWPEYEFPIICTGAQDPTEIIKEEKLKIVQHFQKPFNTSEVLNTINNYFKISSTR